MPVAIFRFAIGLLVIFSSAVGATTPTYTPTATPTPSVYSANIRAHSGVNASWKPVSNRADYNKCEIVNPATNGVATCPNVDPYTGQAVPSGAYRSNSGYTGIDFFDFRYLNAQGLSTNTAKVTVEITTPCTGNRCYSLMRLGNLSPTPLNYRYLAVNDLGEVAGTARYCYFCADLTAFFWSPTTNRFVILNDMLTPVFGSPPTSEYYIGLNNISTVVTFFGIGDRYRYSVNDGYYAIQPHTGLIRKSPYGSRSIYPPAMNGIGHVVLDGYIWDTATDTVRGPLFLPGFATDINDKGQICGTAKTDFFSNIVTFFWDESTGYVTFAPTWLGNFSDCTALNNNGRVAGNYLDVDGIYRSFLWDASSGIQLLDFYLDPPNPPRNSFPSVKTILDNDTIIGSASSNYWSSNYVRTTADGIAPLFHLQNASGAGWDIAIHSFSNNGNIVGIGYHADVPGSELVVLIPVRPPVSADVELAVLSGNPISWIPKVSDPDGNAVTCRLGTAPLNGTATVSTDCLLGTYQANAGFIGTDSFTYIANNGTADSNPGTVTVAVAESQSDLACLKKTPVSQFTQTGKEGTITISFTGNITAHTNKVVKICPGTPLKYQTSSTQGPVVCQVKNNTTRGSGSLKINDHIKCTDKPAGKDKVQFKVKSGVNK